MTVKELYEWAVANGAENFDIEILYRDDGDYYHGADDYLNLVIEKREEEYPHHTEKVVFL